MSGEYSSGVIVALAVNARGKRIVRTFEESQAVSTGSAKKLADLGISESRQVKRLEQIGVLSVTPEGRYYLNRDRWYELREARKRRAVMVLALCGVLVLAYWLIAKP